MNDGVLHEIFCIGVVVSYADSLAIKRPKQRHNVGETVHSVRCWSALWDLQIQQPLRELPVCAAQRMSCCHRDFHRQIVRYAVSLWPVAGAHGPAEVFG
jgi:hypothetical protein